MRRPGLECNLEKYLTGSGCQTLSPVLVHENADLLIARTGIVQMACQSGYAPVHLRDRDRLVVEPLDGCEQCRTDPGSRCSHAFTVAEVRSQHTHETVPIHAK